MNSVKGKFPNHKKGNQGRFFFQNNAWVLLWRAGGIQAINLQIKNVEILGGVTRVRATRGALKNCRYLFIYFFSLLSNESIAVPALTLYEKTKCIQRSRITYF